MSSEIDASAAAAAIEAAGGLGTLLNAESGLAPAAPVAPPAAPEPPAPASQGIPTPGQATPATPVLGEQPIAQYTQGAPVDPPSFSENFDPNSLPPELVPAYRQMQADYTRKTQEVAPYRSIADQFGDMSPEDLSAAVETYQTLQDPTAWQQLHSELTEQLTNMGVPLGQAQTIAADAVNEQAAPVNDPRAILNQLNDPEYAPLKQAFEGMFSEIDSFRAEQEATKQAAQEEAAINAMTAEIKRMENTLRQDRPDYTDDDFNAIYELSPVYEGNLIEAAKRYDGMIESRLQRYLAQKTAAAGNPGFQAVPGGDIATQAPSDYNPTTLEDPMVDAAVKERLAQLDALESGGTVG